MQRELLAILVVNPVQFLDILISRREGWPHPHPHGFNPVLGFLVSRGLF